MHKTPSRAKGNKAGVFFSDDTPGAFFGMDLGELNLSRNSWRSHESDSAFQIENLTKIQ
jgi:hypothetical protein